MKLDFSTLTKTAIVQPAKELWGQAGTMGTSMPMRCSAMTTIGDALGTSGDKGAKHMSGAACPQPSPRCPPLQSGRKPNRHEASPMSLGVPSYGSSDGSDDAFDREAFEERAAIMEFDGGMSRTQAEAAACKIINAMRASAHIGTKRT